MADTKVSAGSAALDPPAPPAEAAPEAKKPFSASNLQMHLWGIGGFADYMLYLPISLAPILVNEFKLDPRWVGWAFAFPRIFDGIIDPFMGHLSDITHSRWGRRRPFILGSAILGAIFMVALWWMSPSWGQWFVAHAPDGPPWLAQWWATRDWGQTVMFAWLSVMSIIIFTCFGVYDMAHFALGYELSDDYSVRTKVMAIRGFWYSLATIAGGSIYLLAMKDFFGHPGPDGKIVPDGVNGMRWLSIGMAAIVLLGGLVVFFACKERFAKANKKHVKVWQALRTTLQVKPFVIVLLMNISSRFGGGLYGITAFYIGCFYVYQGDKSGYNFLFAFVNSIVGVVLAFLFMPYAARLTRKVGKRQGIILCSAFALLSAILLPFFAQPGHPYLFYALALAFTPIAMFNGLLLGALVPDICDIDELTSGERREGLFAAVGSFVSKMLGSLMSLASGYILFWAGFDKDAPMASHQALINLCWLGFAPNIIFAAVTLVIAFFLPMTEESMKKVHAELELRRASGLAQEGLAE